MNELYQYDVLVIGAGHAGTEAALAAARLGAKTALLTTNCDTVGQMSCNPAIGGIGKGQIVREIDALGGAMGLAIDQAGIQFRMLNLRKGPAMHSPRAQADKRSYQMVIKQMVESQPHLTLRQEVVEDLITEPIAKAGRIEAPVQEQRIVGVRVRGDITYRAQTVVLTTGTFLQALMHTGETSTPGGRAGEGTTGGISSTLKRLGIQLARFKTGTPSPTQWPHDRLYSNPTATGRFPAPAVFISKHPTGCGPIALPHHLHQRKGPSMHTQ